MIIPNTNLQTPPELNEEFSWKVYCTTTGEAIITKKNNPGIPTETFSKFEIPDAEANIYRTHFEYLFPRLKGHVQRLCSTERGIVENLFGLVVTETYPNPIEDEMDILPEVAKGEFATTSWWWSVSPYLLFKLISQGVEKKSAFEAICEWGNTVEEFNDPLPGLEEELDALPNMRLVLNKDETHISHKYSIAVAELVLAKAPQFKQFSQQ